MLAKNLNLFGIEGKLKGHPKRLEVKGTNVMLMFSGIVLLTTFPFFGALPEASAMPNDDLSAQLAKIE